MLPWINSLGYNLLGGTTPVKLEAGIQVTFAISALSPFHPKSTAGSKGLFCSDGDSLLMCDLCI